MNFDNIVNDVRFLPFHGWHDDYKQFDRRPEYRPAIQQNKSEFLELMRILEERGLNDKCLELGLGLGGTHRIFEETFKSVLTVEFSPSVVSDFNRRFSDRRRLTLVGDTHDPNTKAGVISLGFTNVDFLFLDAGHLLPDIRADFLDYFP